MKYIFLVTMMFLFVSCTSAPATPSGEMVQTAIAQTMAARPAQTNTTVGNLTEIPTDTLEPTDTPIPTDTPQPSPTSTPPPEPLNFSGTGDAVVDVNKWVGAATVHLVYTGNANFIVTSLDENNEMIELLVNRIGQYDGSRPLDFFDNQKTARLEIQSSGDWTIDIFPIAVEYLNQLAVPGLYEGAGDDVVLLMGETPDIAKFTHNGEANFIVTAYGGGYSLLINEIGAYQGDVIIPNETRLIDIVADKDWTMEITSR